MPQSANVAHTPESVSQQSENVVQASESVFQNSENLPQTNSFDNKRHSSENVPQLNQSVLKTQNNEWTTLHSIVLTKLVNTTKVLSLKHPNNNKNFILADLRVYYDNGKATRNGVCLTEYEFNYLARVLVYARCFEQTLVNKTGARSLVIKPNTKIGGVQITQAINDRIRKLNLTGLECGKIIDNYGSFYHIIEECQHPCNDTVDIPTSLIEKDCLERTGNPIEALKYGASQHYEATDFHISMPLNERFFPNPEGGSLSQRIEPIPEARGEARLARKRTYDGACQTPIDQERESPLFGTPKNCEKLN